MSYLKPFFLCPARACAQTSYAKLASSADSGTKLSICSASELTVPCSGTGYIGSFTSLALLENGYEVVIVDNLYNSSEVALDRIELICGKRPKFYKADITDKAALDKIFQENPAIDSVIHFAALKASLAAAAAQGPSLSSSPPPSSPQIFPFCGMTMLHDTC